MTGFVLSEKSDKRGSKIYMMNDVRKRVERRAKKIADSRNVRGYF